MTFGTVAFVGSHFAHLRNHDWSFAAVIGRLKESKKAQTQILAYASFQFNGMFVVSSSSTPQQLKS